MPPVAPMLAKSVKDVPDGPGFLYEPKWDGFRCIVFRDGEEIELGSRNERPMTRYFPEVVAAVKEQLPERCVVDAEIVVAAGDKLDFEALLQRIHPAKSRVDLLAEHVEVELRNGARVVADHHQLAVDHDARRQLGLGLLDDLGKVPGHRLAAAAGQLDLVAVAEHDAAEAVPLRLVEHVGPLGRQLTRELRKHRFERGCHRQRHRVRL